MLAASTAVLSVCLSTASPAGASGVLLDLSDTVQATTTLATLHQTVDLSAGTFNGTVNDNAQLKGHLVIPATTTTLKLAGVGLARVTIGFAPTKPVTGVLDLGTLSIHATATQYILVTKVEPLGLPINLVGSGCTTSTAVSIPFVGLIASTGVVTATGTYTIPSFSHCSGLAKALDLAVSGSGNTFNATLTPT
jgi:hypothetical protein